MFQSIHTDIKRTSSCSRCPSCCPALSVTIDIVASQVHTYGLNVIGEVWCNHQLQDGNIVTRAVAHWEICDFDWDLIGVGAVLIESAQDNSPSCSIGGTEQKRKRSLLNQIILSWHQISIFPIYHWPYLGKQLAEVMTNCSAISAPPQTWLPLNWTLATQGHMPEDASRLFPPAPEFSLALPHTTATEIGRKGSVRGRSYQFEACDLA